MIQRYHIKYQSFHKGQSLRSIAKDTGHDFRTVKKYAEQTDFNLKTKPKKGRPSKLDPVKPIISWANYYAKVSISNSDVRTLLR